jgi:hypothetical protein
MTIFALTAESFGDQGRAWVEAVSGIFDVAIAKIGVLGLAAIAVYQNLRTKVAIKEVKARQDRQAERIHEVALAVPATAAAAAKEVVAEANNQTGSA